MFSIIILSIIINLNNYLYESSISLTKNANIISFIMNASNIKNEVVIIGDSNFRGDFGHYFHKLVAKSKYLNTTSIAIGGAGSYTYVNYFYNKTAKLKGMSNICCGYTVRESYKTSEYIHTISEQNVKTDEYIGVLSDFVKPSTKYAIIFLGSNQVDAHKKLITELKAISPNIKYIWIGPQLHKFEEKISTRIKNAIDDDKIGEFVQNCTFGEKDKEMLHYGNDFARMWAKDVILLLKMSPIGKELKLAYPDEEYYWNKDKFKERYRTKCIDINKIDLSQIIKFLLL